MSMTACIKVLLQCTLIFAFYLTINSEDVGKLPFCDEVKHTNLFFVSTLDGALSALTATGNLVWKINTEPGPLLNSNIHKLELTNNGQWIRIIPSLSGSLYKFDGVTIDAIPISADSLLMSSFRYSDDLVIAGGREVRTYGVLLNSGQQLYECSWEGCKNTTDYSDNLGDVIVIERKTHIVHAVEPRTGLERWNFSVGQHNIKIPFINCVDPNTKNINIHVSAVLPEGLMVAHSTARSAEILWQHRFETPIVAIWKWNGHELVPMNLFSSEIVNVKGRMDLPSIYIGMHNKQLYIHESFTMQNVLQLKQHVNGKNSVVESHSITQIPWKPIPATSLATKHVDRDDDSTALSVLYASEYVNGNGYYLYSEENTICESNSTNGALDAIYHEGILYWWKEIFLLSVTTILIYSVMYNYRIFGFSGWKHAESDSSASTQFYSFQTNSDSETKDLVFNSRYMTEFEPISCLGKGGFGVVFHAKKKFDECSYAVKRITLPNKPAARDRMMREVKALAKLDHRNIVRYYNAWLECPPPGWQRQHDQQWLNDFSSYIENSTTSIQDGIQQRDSLAICVESSSCTSSDTNAVLETKKTEPKLSSSVVFQNSSTTASTVEASDLDEKESQWSESFNKQKSYLSPVYLYIQMQLCCKESLKDWLSNNFARDRRQTLGIFEQIVGAVEYVHFRGLIHRDLKPSNIFFSLEGQIKVGDFGLVTSIKEYADDEDEHTPGALERNYTNAVGTQLYMSPEQLNGQQYNYKVDIYSLGIIFFELLVPFTTEMERIRALTDLRNYIYPKNFDTTFITEFELLHSMLSVNPEDRPDASGIHAKLPLEGIRAIEASEFHSQLLSNLKAK